MSNLKRQPVRFTMLKFTFAIYRSILKPRDTKPIIVSDAGQLVASRTIL